MWSGAGVWSSGVGDEVGVGVGVERGNGRGVANVMFGFASVSAARTSVASAASAG